MQRAALHHMIAMLTEAGSCPCPSCDYELLPVVTRSDDGALVCSECGHTTMIIERYHTLLRHRIDHPSCPWYLSLSPAMASAAYFGLTILSRLELLRMLIPLFVFALCGYVLWLASHIEQMRSYRHQPLREIAGLWGGIMFVNVLALGIAGLMIAATLLVLGLASI